jgi:SAM-dependent methyltransferase
MNSGTVKQTNTMMKAGAAGEDWFAAPLGQGVLTMEKNRISRILPDLFGYHILQINGQATEQLLDSSRIQHKIVFDQQDVQKPGKIPDVICSANALPVAPESIDVVVLPHVIEFSSNPHQILRESERVLIGEGHLIIIGFNPYSFWGLWRMLLTWREQVPWNGHYIEMARLKDWLSLLDFEIIKTERFYFRPPLSNSKLMKKLLFMEQLGQFCCSYFGGVYLIVAKKRVISMTPIKLQWQTRRRMISAGAIEPSARMKNEH